MRICFVEMCETMEEIFELPSCSDGKCYLEMAAKTVRSLCHRRVRPVTRRWSVSAGPKRNCSSAQVPAGVGRLTKLVWRDSPIKDPYSLLSISLSLSFLVSIIIRVARKLFDAGKLIHFVRVVNTNDLVVICAKCIVPSREKERERKRERERGEWGNLNRGGFCALDHYAKYKQSRERDWLRSRRWMISKAELEGLKISASYYARDNLVAIIICHHLISSFTIDNFVFFIINIMENFICLQVNSWYGHYFHLRQRFSILWNELIIIRVNIENLNCYATAYLPKKALNTKSNFFLRNSDSGIFGPCGVKKEGYVRSVSGV